MTSLFLDILNKEIQIFREKITQQKRDEINIFLTKSEQNEFVVLDCEFSQFDQTHVLNIQDGKQLNLSKYYIAKSKDYSIDIFFDQIYLTPSIKLVFKNVIILEETIKPNQNKDQHKLISNIPKYEGVLMQLKKMYFSQNYNYDFTSKIIMKTSINDKESKAKLLKIGKTANCIINQVDQDEDLSSNSCTSVLPKYSSIPKTNFDYKKVHVVNKNTVDFALPKKKQKVLQEKKILKKDLSAQEIEFPNELISQQFQDYQTGQQIDDTNVSEHSSVDHKDYQIHFDNQRFNKKTHIGFNKNKQIQNKSIDIDQSDDDVTLADQSEIDFEQLKKNTGNKRETMQKLLAMIPNKLRSQKKSSKNYLNDKSDLNISNLRQIDNINKKEKKFKRGQKYLFKEVDEQKKKKKQLFPQRDYFIVSDDEFDIKEECLHIKQRLINSHLQLPQNPLPPKLSIDQIKQEKIEYKLENESDDEQYMRD
ncbi:hypothetical protein ABPG72_018730 [Tetrahymena utriculariae]